MLIKKVKYISLVSFTSLLIISCGTTSATNTSFESVEQSENIITVPASIPEVVEVKKTEEQIFAENLKEIVINQVSVPKDGAKNKEFSAPFVVQITDSQGNPLSGFEVTAKIPDSKKDGVLQYSTNVFTASEVGLVEINGGKPDFACNSEITVSPFIPENLNAEDETLSEIIKEKTITIPYKVKSNVINKGTVLFVWDYNEKGNPVSNSATILSELRKRGVWMIGNAPVSDKSYIGKPLKNLYDANYEIIEDQYGYLLYGTVKFVTPVTALEEGGYGCTMEVEMTGIEMKNGNQVFKTTVTHSSSGANWNKCVSNCKDEIAVKVVDELIYGL